MRNRKVVKLNESQLRTLVRGMMKENVDQGKVLYVNSNNFWQGGVELAINALEEAGFEAIEVELTPKNREFYLTGDERMDPYVRRPVIRVTKGFGFVNKNEIENILIEKVPKDYRVGMTLHMSFAKPGDAAEQENILSPKHRW